MLTGSAEAVLEALDIEVPPALKRKLRYLYITFLTRDCDNPDLEAAEKYCIDLEGTTLIPLDAQIAIAERSYIQPGTTTGGISNIMLYPRIIAAKRDF